MKLDTQVASFRKMAATKKPTRQVVKPKVVAPRPQPQIEQVKEEYIDENAASIQWGEGGVTPVDPMSMVPQSLRGDAGLYPVQQQQIVAQQQAVQQQSTPQLTEQQALILQRAKADALKNIKSEDSNVKRQPKSRCMCANGCTQADCLYFDRQGYQPIREVIEKLVRTMVGKDPQTSTIIRKIIKEELNKTLATYV